MRIGFILMLVAAAVASRWLPHPPNFTPILGLSLFLGHIVPSRLWAVTATVAVMVLSDLILGWHGMWAYVYAALALGALLGHWIENRWAHVVPAALASSFLFFVISNFGMWMTGYYSMTFEGLVTCYIAAIPFFGNTLASTMLSSVVLFGALQLFEGRMASSHKIVS